METELRKLAAELRQLALSEMARGVLDEPVAIAEPVENFDSPSPQSPSDDKNPWFELAASERSVEGRTLEHIREEMGDCKRCNLCQNRKNIVFGVGSETADLLIIGEAPGYHEDQQGEPFVGPAGQMLDRMLENVLGLRRDEVYIANVVKCRPPKNRNPLPDEVASCLPFLEAQLLALRPKIVLILGTVALKTVLNTQAGIMRSRGVWKDWNGIPVMPTFHPAYLLRNSADKRLTFQDLKAVRARYDAEGGRRS